MTASQLPFRTLPSPPTLSSQSSYGTSQGDFLTHPTHRFPSSWRQRPGPAVAGSVSLFAVVAHAHLPATTLTAPICSSKMTADRRVPAPGQATAVRLPPRTSRQTDRLDHSHIRIVPHLDDDGGIVEECDESVPTFRSPSLQFTFPITAPPRTNEESSVASLSQARTFADMARRYHHTDSDEQPPVGHSSPAGIVKLQPHRKTWRPMRASDLSQCENAGDDTSEPSSDFHTFAHHPRESALPHDDRVLPVESTLHSELQSMLDKSTQLFRASCASYTARADEKLRNEAHVSPGDECEKLFGKLPDLIRLQEQTGEFNGQVVFIGHPNRDVSAHQWSSTSFQWVNIGRYAQVRRRVEGSLACDSLRGYHVSQNPLEFFKHAAENREKLAIQESRPKADPREPASSTLAEETTRVASGTSAFAYSSRVSAELPPKSSPSNPDPSNDSVIRERLEDPFVAHAKSLLPYHTSHDLFKKGKEGLKGSLDLKYEFPDRADASVQPTPLRNPDRIGVYADNRQRRVNTDHHTRDSPDSLLQPSLQDVSFGEDASGSAEAVEGRHSLQPNSLNYAPIQNMGGYRVPEDNLVRLEGYTSYAGASTGSGIKMTKPPGLYATARSLFPASGLTVANPRRTDPEIMSSGSLPTRLHATVVPDSESSSSQGVAVSAAEATLKFSDPDGLRKSKEYAIANGLSKQAPTAQNFKGPFFTDSKPTTHDPTAQLSVHVGEEEKLSTWFHDGHCPARQQEYAKSLILTAVSYRRSRKLGAVGEMMDAQAGADYKNTFAFVRLYENLSEYVDEPRNGCGAAYFTRSWKTRSHHVSPNNRSSYFSRPTTTTLRTEGTSGARPAGSYMNCF